MKEVNNLSKTTNFNPLDYEPRWLAEWEARSLFCGTADDETLSDKKKRFLLFAFAYPSGTGLHVGHVESKTALDILSRFYRMQGEAVFFPVGWDAFGLPAENYAIKTGIPPVETTKQAIDTFRRQIKRLAISYDWKSEIATCHPGYYKWTQWLFIQLYKKGLAYQGTGMVNWCPSCQTVLANEQVVEGACERCETQVVQKEMKQWFFRITQYQDELISGLDQVDWPEPTKQQQLHWIGRSEGVKIKFGVAEKVGSQVDMIECFTTRVDTVFGVTFLAVSPEKLVDWGLLEKVPVKNRQAVNDYLAQAGKKTEEERKIGEKDKTGVDTGLRAINPVNGEEVPIYVADYVLAGYGTGAVMGVPAHDERDWAFAIKHSLPIKRVIAKSGVPAKSYLMGGANITDEELTSIGVRIVETLPNGDRKLEIPESKVAWRAYEDLIKKKLEPGFWNEQIGVDSGFIFKLSPENSEMSIFQEGTKQFLTEKVNKLLATNDIEVVTEDLWSYLAKNSYYTDYIRHSEYGILVNSGDFCGISSQEALKKIPAEFPDSMEVTTNYKLRDWLISRQRYWGAPIPIVYDPDGEPHVIDDANLPWSLPTDVDFKPTGESPLVSSIEFQQRTEKYVVEHFADLIAERGWDQAGKGWRPEYDTMDTFVDSSWYYLRYGDARNEQEFASQEKIERWLPVDFYMIGPEHIVLHLLYSRFFTKFLRDEGYLNFDEPFLKMRHQGMILGPDGKKMSKSKGNVINPDDVIEKFGADTLRLYEMFMGPIEADKPWDVRAVSGVYRFLGRLHGLTMTSIERLSTDQAKTSDASQAQVRKALHTMIKKVTGDIPQLKFNTAIAAMMSFVNVWEDQGVELGEDDLAKLVRVIAPFAPFMAEELQQQLKSVDGQKVENDRQSVHEQTWPSWDEELLVESVIKVAVQVNGKLRGEILVPAEVIEDKEKVIKFALEQQSIKKWVDSEIIKSIYVVGKILNFVVG